MGTNTQELSTLFAITSENTLKGGVSYENGESVGPRAGGLSRSGADTGNNFRGIVGEGTEPVGLSCAACRDILESFVSRTDVVESSNFRDNYSESKDTGLVFGTSVSADGIGS
jgi:hypothetical protein